MSRQRIVRLALLVACAALPACGSPSNPPDDSGEAELDALADVRDVGPDDPGEAHADEDTEDFAEATPDESDVRDRSREEDVADFVVPEAVVLPPTCGDGRLDPGEECDDGNRMDGDGCDFLCRSGAGTYEVPPPDESVPPIAPTGEPVEVTVGEDMAVTTLSGVCAFDRCCRPITLAAGGGRFGVAYNTDQPEPDMRFRVLDRTGVAVGTPWVHATDWLQPWDHALLWTGSEFALFSAFLYTPLYLTRFRSDGTPIAELVHAREADPYISPEGPMHILTTAAWRADRYLVAGPWPTDESGGVWNLGTFAIDARALGEVLVPVDLTVPGVHGCVLATATAEGFTVTDGEFLVAVDPELRPVGWSGRLADMEVTGALAVTADGVWLAWLRQAAGMPYPPGGREVWLAGFDLLGTPLFPPRAVTAPFPHAWTDDAWVPLSTNLTPGIAIAAGPAGLAVVYWEGRGADLPGGWVRIINTDRWGNVRSGPTNVLLDDGVTSLGFVLAVAADDDGYGVVTAVPGTVAGTAELVFRHYAPAL